MSAYALKQASFLRALLQDSVDIWLPALSARGLTPSWTTEYSVLVANVPKKKPRTPVVPDVSIGSATSENPLIYGSDSESGLRSSSEEDGGTSDSEALRDDGDNGYMDYDSD